MQGRRRGKSNAAPSSGGEGVRVEVRILPRPDLHHPEGETVARALSDLGFGGVEDLRVGRLVVFTLREAEGAERRVREICRRLLVNEVTETFSFSIEGVG